MATEIKCLCGREISIPDDTRRRVTTCPDCQSRVILEAGEQEPVAKPATHLSCPRCGDDVTGVRKACKKCGTDWTELRARAEAASRAAREAARHDSDERQEREVGQPEPQETDSTSEPSAEDASGSEEHDQPIELATEQQLKRGTERCPGCGAGLAPGSVFCVQCGTNLQTGQKAQTVVRDGGREMKATLPGQEKVCPACEAKCPANRRRCGHCDWIFVDEGTPDHLQQAALSCWGKRDWSAWVLGAGGGTYSLFVACCLGVYVVGCLFFRFGPLHSAPILSFCFHVAIAAVCIKYFSGEQTMREGLPVVLGVWLAAGLLFGGRLSREMEHALQWADELPMAGLIGVGIVYFRTFALAELILSLLAHWSPRTKLFFKLRVSNEELARIRTWRIGPWRTNRHARRGLLLGLAAVMLVWLCTRVYLVHAAGQWPDLLLLSPMCLGLLSFLPFVYAVRAFKRVDTKKATPIGARVEATAAMVFALLAAGRMAIVVGICYWRVTPYDVAKWRAHGSVSAPRLVNALGDVNPDVRAAAASALAEIGGPSVVGLLTAALGDTRREVRLAASRAMVRIGEPALQPLIEALRHPEANVREAAAVALGEMRETTGVRPLVKALADTEDLVRRAASVGLTEIGSPAVPVLIEAVKDDGEVPVVRSSAARILGQMRAVEAIEALIGRFKDKDAGVRTAAVVAVKSIGGPSVPHLTQTLTDKNEPLPVRSSAAGILGVMGPQFLVDALKDQDPVVRRLGVSALENTSDPASIDLLMLALQDNDADVRSLAGAIVDKMLDGLHIEGFHGADSISGRISEYAGTLIKALHSRDTPRALRLKIRALHSRDAATRARSTGEIAMLGKEAAPAIPFLIGMLSDDSPLQIQTHRDGKLFSWGSTTPGWEAAQALARIGQPAAEPLIDALATEDADVRQYASWALGEIGDARAVGALVSMLMDKSPVVRKRTAKALGKIGDSRATEPLIPLLTDDNADVRGEAARALGKFADRRAVEPLISALSRERRGAVVWALGEIADPRAVDHIIPVLSDDNADLRSVSATALRKIKDPRAVGPLIAALEDRDGRGRWEISAIVAALRELTAQRFGDDLAKWREWWEQNKTVSPDARQTNREGTAKDEHEIPAGLRGGRPEAMAKVKASTEWTCVKHPSVKLPKVGKCPVCYLDLVPYPAGQAPLPKPKPEAHKEGFLSLFNGRDLTGWMGSTKGYVAEKGNLVRLKEGGGNLYTEDEYSDFILRFDFKLPPGSNSGVGIRVPVGARRPAAQGIEIQILDNTAPKYANLKPCQYHGSIYCVVPARRGHLKPVGQWNSQEIVAHGRRITVKLNGVTILDADLDEAAAAKAKTGRAPAGFERTTGHICFSGHGSRVEFRKILIKELRQAK